MVCVCRVSGLCAWRPAPPHPPLAVRMCIYGGGHAGVGMRRGHLRGADNACAPAASTRGSAFCLLGGLLLLQMSSGADGAQTCPQYCASQAGARDCESGGDALRLATCVCDWAYRGNSRGCVRDFGGFICDDKPVGRVALRVRATRPAAARAPRRACSRDAATVCAGLCDERGVC